MSDEDTILKAMKDAGKPLRPGEIANLTGDFDAWVLTILIRRGVEMFLRFG